MKVTVPEAARRVGRNPETVRRWIWSGRLPSEKVGNQHLVDVEALDRLAAAAEPTGEALAAIRGEWRDWLRAADALRRRLVAEKRSLPPASDLLAESRRRR
jgi:excisionase family DNA binding protein